MADNPLDALGVIMEKIREIAEENGLGMEGFAVIPGAPGGPHYCQAVFSLDPERAFKSNEERKIDDEFETLMRMNRITEHEEKVEEIQTVGLDLLRGIEQLGGKGGIGLDDDDESEPTDPPVPTDP